MSTPFQHHRLQLQSEQRQRLTAAYDALSKQIEHSGTLSPAMFNTLQQEMRKTLDGQPGLEKLPDHRLDEAVLHLTYDDGSLLNLPWQLATQEYPLLALSKGLARQGEDLPLFTPGLAPPLKILVMIAAPEDATIKNRLDYEQEEAQIILAFRKLYESARVEIHFTEDGSLESLAKALTENDYHILHFSGHGVFGEYKNEAGEEVRGGRLLLEDPVTNRSRMVTAEQFALCLKTGNTPPAMVLLSSCQTAQGGVLGTELQGVAHQLLQAHIPAVIAMGFSISDYYATWFAAAFYEQLAHEQPVYKAFRLAVDRTRQQEKEDGNPLPAQWIIPQLYCSSRCEQVTDWTKARKDLKFSAYKFVTGEQRLLLEQKKGYRFIGRRRERRAALARLLQRQPVHLRGAGGVGKTALAEHLVQRLIARQPEAGKEVFPFVFDEKTTNLQGVLNAL